MVRLALEPNLSICGCHGRRVALLQDGFPVWSGEYGPEPGFGSLLEVELFAESC